MPRKAEEGDGKLDRPLDYRARRIEPHLENALGKRAPVVPPGEVLRQPVDLFQIETERLADITQRALRPIGDEGGRDRGAVAPVLAVDVLDDLLAPVVLEIDVDVGRLVALLRDKALEQAVHARRIDLGDAERVADGGVRRRAAPLAKDFFRTRELDHVADGEKERLVFELGDERELVLDQLAYLARNAIREAPRQSFLGQLAQPARRSFVRGDELFGILVAQLLQRKTATLGN